VFVSRAVAVGLLFAAASAPTACGRARRTAAVLDCTVALEHARDFRTRIDAATVDEIEEEGRRVVETCAAMYSNAACREGMHKAWSKETDPSQRLRITLETCRDAYCPELPPPKPSLCTSLDLEHPDLARWQAQWVEFDDIVLERDLGSLYPRLAEARRASRSPR
jgi:hypothetical protein